MNRKPLILWAVVIGRGNPYVAFAGGHKLNLHHAFPCRHRAETDRRRILSCCGHKEVFVRKFVEEAGNKT